MKKRPRDPSQLAKMIVDIASGEIEDRAPQPLTRKEAAELGGKKRAEVLSKNKRSQIASKAAKTRWKAES